MIGGITYMGWFHTIVGIPAIIVGLYLLFRDRFIIVDNNDANEPPHLEVFKRVKQLANKKVTNGIAKRWIANELEMKKRI